LAIVDSGKVYTFGDGQNGQLGQGTNVIESPRPALVGSLKDIKIKYSACGENFTALISGMATEWVAGYLFTGMGSGISIHRNG